MHWEPCEVCKESVIIFDLKRTPTGFRCEPPCVAKGAVEPPEPWPRMPRPAPVRPEGPGPTQPVVPPPPPTHGHFQHAVQFDEAVHDEDMHPPHGTLLNKEESQAIWSIILKSRGSGPYDPEGDRLIRALFRVTGNDKPNLGGDAFPESIFLPRAQARHKKLQDDFGFKEPEDGSERRFVFSATKRGQKPPWVKQPVTVPWVKFRFWWLLHNAVAHPLIAIAPRRTFFRFHDYTSRRMHGK